MCVYVCVFTSRLTFLLYVEVKFRNLHKIAYKKVYLPQNKYIRKTRVIAKHHTSFRPQYFLS